MKHTILRVLTGATAVALLAVSGCTMKDVDEPPLSGPSEFATSLAISATPDMIAQDGASQSVVTALVRDSQSQPLANVPLRAEIYVGGVAMDFGQLSARNIATDGSGRATVVYTAPSGPAQTQDNYTIVSIALTPIGTNYDNSSTRFVSIRLLPPGVILAPNGTPVPEFSFSPLSPEQGQKIAFDASASTDPQGADTIVSYDWSFSDGGTRTGKVVTIAFNNVGTYTATLTVGDSGGLRASKTKSFTVGASTAPTAAFTFSPSPVSIGQTVFFNASESAAAAGHTISSYAWNFGDGTTATGITTSKVFSAAATYTVTLTVTDNVGQKGVKANDIEVVP